MLCDRIKRSGWFVKQYDGSVSVNHFVVKIVINWRDDLIFQRNKYTTRSAFIFSPAVLSAIALNMSFNRLPFAGPSGFRFYK